MRSPDWQASTQWIEFLRNFYKVFPEFQHMDVCLVFIHSFTPLKLSRLDISGRREFCGPVYPVFW